MASELSEAAENGDVPSLLALLAKDGQLLDRIMTGNHTETPLHIAARLGHLDFVEKVLARKPELARKQDSEESTPLHLAAAKGCLNIVIRLLRVDPDMCSVRDKYKRNPLHVAAMKGHVDVLEFLVRKKPDAAHDHDVEHDQTILHLCVKHDRLEALKLLIDILGNKKIIQIIRSTNKDGDTSSMNKDGSSTNKDGDISSTNKDGNTILHLCVKHDKPEALKLLIDIIGDDHQFINSRDQDGNTILHLAAAYGQTETMLFLTKKGCEGNIKNSKGFTAFDLSRDEQEIVRQRQDNMHNMLMVVAILVAAIAFEAGRETESFKGGSGEHMGVTAQYVNVTVSQTGPAYMNVTPSQNVTAPGNSKGHPTEYRNFIACNTISFITSLSVIMLLISDVPLGRRIPTWIPMLTMWVAITFTQRLMSSSYKCPARRRAKGLL